MDISLSKVFSIAGLSVILFIKVVFLFIFLNPKIVNSVSFKLFHGSLSNLSSIPEFSFLSLAFLLSLQKISLLTAERIHVQTAVEIFWEERDVSMVSRVSTRKPSSCNVETLTMERSLGEQGFVL